MLVKMECVFCNRDGIKYSCILCGNPVSNVCAYDEPNYRVGKCPGNKCRITDVNMDVNNEMVNSLNVDGVNNNVYSDNSNSRDVNNCK